MTSIVSICAGQTAAQDQTNGPQLRQGPSVTTVPPARPATPPPLTADPENNSADDQILFEADYVSRQSETSPIVAEGNVQAFFGERYLKADRLEYNPDTDIVVAVGNVSITDENLDTVFAGRVELTGDLRDGIAENFTALLADNARLASDRAIQEQGSRTQLSKAVYTACNVCTDEGDNKIPTWRIKALKVTRDRERRVVRFRHAFLELKGVPILYAPYIQGPDPSVERQSGFLTPLVGASSRLGFNVEIPYYLALSNHTDATFFPKYTSNEGVLWQGEVRHRRNNGYHVISGGIVDVENFNEPTNPNDPPVDIPGVRWNFFGRGNQQLTDHWEVGYDIERVSDDTFLRNFDVRRRGDLRRELDTSNTNRLRSSVSARWAKGGSELNIDSLLFQGLRSTDQSELTPFALPLVNFRHRFDQKIAGGRADINANFVSLQRTSGTDTRRLTANASWKREHITKTGHRFKAFAELRGDLFRFSDLDEGTELTIVDPLDPTSAQPVFPGSPSDPTAFETRFAPTAALEWTYPLTKRTKGARLFIEPRVQLIASPANRNPNSIINEDSQSIEFDYAGLFDVNKSPGFDRFEDGQRANIGVSTSAIFDNGIRFEASVGSQFRLQNSNAFDLSTGLGEERSDIVGSINLRYKNRIGVENRFRIDDDDGSIQRAESMAFLNLGRLRGNLSYVRLNEENQAAALVQREELTGRGTFKITDHWSTGVAWRQNLLTNETIRQDFILSYNDECSTLELTYRRDQTQDAGLPTDNAFLVRFTLRSLVD